MLETHTIFDDAAGSERPARCRVTDIKEAVRSQNRVNIYVDDKFFCSLDIAQVVDFHLKIGAELDQARLDELKRASDFGKFYALALEYALLRPRSTKEMCDYLKRKTLDRKVRVKNQETNEYTTKIRQGYDKTLVPLVMSRLEERGYLDDRRFAELWVENRNVGKGMSIKKMRLELRQKGISDQIVDEVLLQSSRNDRVELRKIIARKASKYSDQQKMIQYLLRQGFNYSDVLDELSSTDESFSS